MQAKYFYSWDALKEDSKLLGEILGSGKYKGILAITRGGLIPAYYLASEIGIRIIETIGISSYSEEDKQGEISLIGTPPKISLEEQKNWLILDDLTDSGKTMGYVKSLYPNMTFVSFVRKSGNIYPDLFAREVENTLWIVMPYENA